jgi:hypothetical protein
MNAPLPIDQWCSPCPIGFELWKAGQISAATAPSGERGRVAPADDHDVVSFDAPCTLAVELEPADGPLRCGRIRITSCDLDEPFLIVLRLGLTGRRPPYFMIPAVLYGTNQIDRGIVDDHGVGYNTDPKLAWRSEQVDYEKCISPHWHVRADRSTMPSVIAVCEDHCVAAGIDEAMQGGDGQWFYNSLGLWTSDDGDSLTIAMGALDWPARFRQHKLGREPVTEPLPARGAIGLTTRFFLYSAEASDRFGYEDFLRCYVPKIHQPPRPGPPADEATRQIAEPLITDGIRPESGYFHMLRDPKGISDGGTLLAWAGIFQIARPLLQCGRLVGEPRYVDVAVEMCDRAVREAYNPASGLFFDDHCDGRWRPNAWWPALQHSALINGHACYLMLKMAEEHGELAHWVDRVRQVLEHVLEHQRDDGRLPSGFDAHRGEPTSYRGFAGSFFIAPLLIAARMLDLDAFREPALRALDHYWHEFTELEWVGVDLDCGGAVDSGSSYALTRALVELHRQQPEPKHLERLAHVLHYACSYHFAHNTRHRNPVCDWSTSGSKVTSTPNVHADAYAGLFLEDIDYYLQHRDDAYFQQRLDDALAWARQAYNRTEAEYGWGKAGWVTEQYYHTYETYFTEKADGTVWVAYFPWTAGALLASFAVEMERARRVPS